jgi:transcriptional regulator with XRE-family HTH domain
MHNLFFGGQLRALRGSRKKNEFAKFLGLSAPAYQKYEDGRIPRADTLLEISKRCGVPLEHLIGINPDDQLHPGQAAPAPPPATLAVAPPATAPPCRYPADCDLVQALAKITERLDTIPQMQAQINTLTQLLGASLRKPNEAPEREHRKKAG